MQDRESIDPVRAALSALMDGDAAAADQACHAWRGDAGADAYSDIAGFCRAANPDEIASHGHVLTPGRYVGAADLDDDEVPFEEKFGRLAAEFSQQSAFSRELADRIASNFEAIQRGA